MQETEGLAGRKARRVRAPVGAMDPPTIGLLTRQVSDELNAPLWAGIASVAREHGANLITFPGGSLRDPQGFQAQGNTLYDLVGSETVDGLVVWTGILGHYVSIPEMAEFCARYSSLPVVSIETAFPGIPSVLADFYEGMRTLITHLITVHGYRRIAFIRGTEDLGSGDERLRGYVDALTEHGLPVDPDLIAPGTFLAPSGEEAVRLLIDERHVQFEALASANDVMAMDALKALQARGIRVPEDVALAGFDDLAEATSAIPPLTTVRLPIQEMGCQAAELLMARLQGKPVPDRVSMPTQFVLRQSCGCPSPQVVQAAAARTQSIRSGEAAGPKRARAADPGSTGHSFLWSGIAQRERIARAMIEAFPTQSAIIDQATAEKLLAAFADDVGGESPGVFMSTLDEALHGSLLTEQSGSVGLWQGAISEMRRLILPAMDERATARRAEDLWQQARVLIGEAVQRAERYARLQAEQQAARLRQFGQELATARDLDRLTQVLTQELGKLGFRGAALALYANPSSPADLSRLIGAYDPAGRVELDAEGIEFPSRWLLPDSLWPRDRLYNLVVEPLYFGAEQLGFILLDVEPRHVAMCDALREQISSALMGALLTQQVQRRAVQLQTAAQISSTASSVLDPNELIRQAVSLVRSQFGLYYVGLFLLDEEGRYAVLRAGTGEAGQQMVAQGHRLEVSRTPHGLQSLSMIGWCIAQQQARVALDVSQESVHVRNPLLPDTRSELALPLLSRGQAIGALTVQSTQRAAFSPEDISVFQTVADQLANAIANARLFEQTQRALRDAEATQRRYLQEAWQEYVVHGYRHSASGEGPAQHDRLGEYPFPSSERSEMEATADTWLPVMGEAVRLGKTVIQQDEQEGATLGVPLVVSGQIVGAIGGAGFRSEGFSPDEVAAVEAIAEQMALALENQRLFDRAQRATALMSERVKALDCLNDIGHKTEEAPPVAEFLEWVARRVTQAMRYDSECVAAVEFEGQVYGTGEALSLPRQMVHRMILAGHPAGRMVIAYRQEHDFLDEESALLGDVVRRASGYVENRRLIEEIRTTLARTEALYQASLQATLLENVPQVLQSIADGVAQALPADRVLLVVLDQDKRLVVHHAWAGPGSAGLELAPYDELLAGLTGWVLREGKPAISPKDETDPREGAEARRRRIESNSGSIIVVPLTYRGQVLGTVTAINRLDQPDFSQGLELMSAMGNQAAAVLLSARLFEETQRALAETETLYEASAELSAAGSYEDVLTTLRSHTVLAQADRSLALALFDAQWTAEHVPEWATVAARHSPLPADVLSARTAVRGAFLADLLHSDEPAIVEDVTIDPRLDQETRHVYAEHLGAHSALMVPLVAGGQWIGYVEALFGAGMRAAPFGRDRSASERAGVIADADVQQLGILAGQAAVAVQTLRQFEQVQAALAEVEATHRRYLHGRWDTYLRQREDLLRSGFVYDQAQDVPALSDLWRPEMKDALRLAVPAQTLPGDAESVESGGDGQEQRAGLAVPIMLRGQPIGVLGIENPEGGQEWSADEIALLEEVGQQLALALENARLFEETQRRAERERLVTEITARIRASTDILGVLETTATELGRALGTSRAIVKLTVEDKASTPSLRSRETH